MRIDIKPLSVNACWQGRRYKTPEYKDFEEECLLLLRNKKMIKGPVVVYYNCYIKNYSRSDVGNFEKPLSDIITKAGLIEDDRFIKKIVMEKFKSKEEYIDIIIEKYEEK